MEPDPQLPGGAPKTVLTPVGQNLNSKSMQDPHPISRMPSDAPAAPNHPPSAGDWNQYTPSLEVQDLSPDRLLSTAPKTNFKGHSVPMLGGIPLLAKLGQGGMGAVYFGIHPRLKQEVAVKVLPFPLLAQNPNMLERFYREAQIAAKVKSPRVVGVLDVNEEHGLFYLVMDYIAGLSAGGYIKRHFPDRMVPEAIAVDICIAATEGLQAAHEQGVIHRDIKPDNILLPRGKTEGEFAYKQAKLADLGLARSEESGASLTGTNSAMGTPGFMAPEQALDAKTARKPADLFSMGATLYDMLCGQPPFTGDSLTKVIIATLSEEYPPVSGFRSDVSPETLAVLDRCLKKEPNERYYDAGELLDALRAARWKASTGMPQAPLPVPAGNPQSAKATVARPHVPMGPLSSPPAGRGVSPVPGSPNDVTVTRGAAAAHPVAFAKPLNGQPISSTPPQSNPSEAFTPTLVKPGGTGMLKPGAGSRAGAPRPVNAEPLFYNPREKKSSGTSFLYLGGALLCAAVLGYFILGGNSFEKDRDQILAQVQPMLESPDADLGNGIKLLKDFESKYTDRTTEEMQPVKNLETNLDRALQSRKGSTHTAVTTPPPVSPLNTPAPNSTQPVQSAESKEAQYKRAVDEAKTLYIGKDLKGAERQLLLALSLNPEDATSKDNLAMIRRELAEQANPRNLPPTNSTTSAGVLDKPIKDAQEAMQSSNYKYAEKTLSRALDDTGASTLPRYDEAKKLLQAARNAQKAEGLLTDAERYTAGGKFNEAREAYTAAREAYFESPIKERIEKGYRDLEGKAKNGAIQDQFDRCMTEARNALNDGHFQNAAGMFNQALKIKPGDSAALEGRKEAMMKWQAQAKKEGNTVMMTDDGTPLPPPPGQQPGQPDQSGQPGPRPPKPGPRLPPK